LRLGITVTIQGSGAGQATVVAWREDAGGGNRVSLGTWTEYTGTIHDTYSRIGFLYHNTFGGTTWRMDNFTVEREEAYTLITLPFDIPVGDGTLKMIKKSDESEYSYTKPTDGTLYYADVDISSDEFWIGWTYTSTWELSEIYKRHWRTGMPELGGILQLSNVLQQYSETRDLIATVTVNSVDYTYTVDEAAAAESALRYPVNTQAKSATIVYTNATVNQCWLQGLSWEGTYSARGRKL